MIKYDDYCEAIMKDPIFITGGAGFIGSHLVHKLAETHAVTVYDAFISSVTTFEHLHNVKVIKGDIRDRNHITQSMKGHKTVISMAAAHLRLSISDPTFVHEVNATGILNTLLAAKEQQVERFVYVSSSEVYGSAIGTDTMREDHRIIPTTVYGVSKYIGELYTSQFGQFEKLPITIVRPFNTYGPRSHFDGPYGEVIPRMVIRVLNDLPPIIFGDGKQSRDFTFVADTVNGIILATDSKKSVGQTINIACGKEISILDIATTICKQINPHIKPIFKSSRPNDVMRHAADISKAQELLHFKPSISIEEGIGLYISYIKETYKSYQDILKQIPETNW